MNKNTQACLLNMNEPSLQSLQGALANIALPMAVLAIVTFILMFVVVGYSMKFALAVAGVGRFGFWKSIGMVTTTGLASGFVSFLVTVAMSGVPSAELIACVASVGAYAVVISMVGQCGISRGFATCFLYGLFSLIGMVPLFTLVGVGGFVIAKNSDLDQIDFEHLKSELAMTPGVIPGGDESGSGFGDLDLTQVSGAVFGEKLKDIDFNDPNSIDFTDPESLPMQLPGLAIPSGDSKGIYDSFFTEERSSPYPTPAPSRCQSGCSSTKSTLPKKVEPSTSGLRSNPFVQ
ncbi:hypothetical protein [Rhodopirellula sallentina]|uniref:hypothetical protein n=1 Tax=Rhodopirellula sallentina TaxID=1263869 RepID=UPI001181C4E4|nr:hypothetical protein [Rhodopirellula sallentina]